MKVLAGLIYDVELEAVWDTECSALLDKLLMALPVEWDDQLIEILPLLEVGLAELALAFLRFRVRRSSSRWLRKSMASCSEVDRVI